MQHHSRILQAAVLALAPLLALIPGRSTRAAGTPYSISILNKNGAVPCDLSADGRIVGGVMGHAFYWSPANQFIDLTPAATVENRALRVNSHGVVLGWENSGHLLWLWDAAAQTLGCRSLDALHNGAADGWQLDATTAYHGFPTPQVSDSGVIAGTGFFNGRVRPYVAVYDQTSGQIASIVNLGIFPGSNPNPDTVNYVGANFGLAASPSGDIVGALNSGSLPAWYISHSNYFTQGVSDDENLAMQVINAPNVMIGLEGSDGVDWYANATGQVATAGNTKYYPGAFWDATYPNNPITLAGIGTGINASGSIAGTAVIAGKTTAFVRLVQPNNNRVTIALGDLGGGSSDCWSGDYYYPVRTINGAGQVVGRSAVKGNTTHAFLWQDLNNNGRSDAGELRDLNNLVPKLTGYLWRASHINDAGQIAGVNVSGNATYAFRLTPNP